MSELKEILKGEPGWRVRKIEMHILSSMNKATTHQTGWHVYQKIKGFVSTTGDDICKLMERMSERGYLDVVGSDYDCGYFYKVSDRYKK